MTGQPERDPEIQAAIDRAAGELARRLKPWATGMADPYTFANTYIEDLIAERWRPPLGRPPDWRQHGQPAPPTDEFRAARAALEHGGT